MLGLLLLLFLLLATIVGAIFIYNRYIKPTQNTVTSLMPNAIKSIIPTIGNNLSSNTSQSK
jgi:uncharacterized protein YneF (UPF0154 family)